MKVRRDEVTRRIWKSFELDVKPLVKWILKALPFGNIIDIAVRSSHYASDKQALNINQPSRRVDCADIIYCL